MRKKVSFAMDTVELGRSGIRVSRIGLGTMTYGQQNSPEEAFRLMDQAVAAGVTLIDAAELYPIPPRAATAGRTETIIGDWLKARRNRSRVVLATKICGPGTAHIRDGRSRFDRATIRAAIDASLRRLGTDWIDLYQLHWPERKTNTFGRLGYVHVEGEIFTPFAEALAALAEEVAAGRIRAFGVSNETPWGVMSCLKLADQDGLPRLASIQNAYSLLNRTFEVGLAEIAIRETCGLLAYSPLGMGTLTGKYLGGARPAGARLTLFPEYTRYTKPRSVAATSAYAALARAHGLEPALLALAFVLSRRFLTSVLVGATCPEQLDTNLKATEVRLEPALLERIEAIHLDNPSPAP
jgi:aryl-alcohol dehydrogenase-like predicted oxidoreductase